MKNIITLTSSITTIKYKTYKSYLHIAVLPGNCVFLCKLRKFTTLRNSVEKVPLFKFPSKYCKRIVSSKPLGAPAGREKHRGP